jgi:hypothetical protein
LANAPVRAVAAKLAPDALGVKSLRYFREKTAPRPPELKGAAVRPTEVKPTSVDSLARKWNAVLEFV